MRVIYIAGTAHSGSTLLDMMLNAHPEIVSVGELLKLNRVIKYSKGIAKATRCSCGAVGLLQCSFWSRVNKKVEEATGKSIIELKIDDYDEGKTEPDANSAIFRAIAQVSGKKFVVDSSKIPRRLRHLMRNKELNVYPIHLVRSPAGQIASVISQHGLMKSILYYEVVHAQIRRALKSIPHGIVRYEDLVADQTSTLQNILEPIGLDFHPAQLRWAEQEKHSFAGNHARFRPTSEIVLDQGWRDRLSRSQRFLIKLGTCASRVNMFAARRLALPPMVRGFTSVKRRT